MLWRKWRLKLDVSRKQLYIRLLLYYQVNGGYEMAQIASDCKVELREEVSIYYKEDDIYMLMDCINGDVFEINETSKKIIDEIVTGSDIKIIYKKFNNIDNNITIEDIIKFVEVLYDNGLVRILQ